MRNADHNRLCKSNLLFSTLASVRGYLGHSDIGNIQRVVPHLLESQKDQIELGRG